MAGHRLNAEVATLMRDVARDVVLPHFQTLAADQIMEKTPGDFVTIADQLSEERLAEGLARILPEARVVGEEGVAADPSLMDNLGQGLAWIVDPIDGTGNYAEGRTPFAIMVALIADGETEAGWILDPNADRMLHAARGQGAFVNDAPLRTRPTGHTPPRAALAMKFLTPEARADIEARIPGRLTAIPVPYCAGAEYGRLVTGANDIALYGKMLPWDHAPGALILTEAGGRIAHYDGSAYRPTNPGRGLLAAATPQLWDLAGDVLLD